MIGSIPAAVIGLLYREEIKEQFFDIYSIEYLIPVYFIMSLLIFSSKFYHDNKRTEIVYFDFEMICIDNAGYQFIDGANESKDFRGKKINLKFLDFDPNTA